MDANQIESLLSQIQSHIAQGDYDGAKPGLNGLVEVAETLTLELPAFVRLVKALRTIAEYEDNVVDVEKPYAACEKMLGKAREQHPGAPALINETGLLYFAQLRFEEALSEYKVVIDDPSANRVEKETAFQWGSACYRRTFRADLAETQINTAAASLGENSLGVMTERAWLGHDDARNFTKALGDFGKILEGEPTHESPLVGQLCCLHLLGDQVGIERRLKSLQGLLPKKVILTILGKCGAIHDSESRISADLRLPAGLLAWQEMTLLDPNNPYLLGVKAAELRDLREYRRAEEVCCDALKKFPKHQRLRLQSAWLHYYQQRYKEALKEFDSDVLSENSEAREWVVTTLRKMNQFPEALKQLDAAFIKFKESAGLLSEKATLYFSERRYEEAIETFDRALQLRKDDEYALQWRIAARRKLRQFDQAATLIAEAIKILPYSPELYAEQGWLLFDQDKLEGAEVSFRKASDLDPYEPRFAFGTVEVLLRLGRIGEAERILEDLHNRFKDDDQIEERLGWFYLGQNRPFEAQRVFLQMLTRDKESVAAINGMGGFCLDQRDYHSAETQFREAIKRIDYQPQYHINLAWALLKQANDVSGLAQIDPIIGAKKLSLAAKFLLDNAHSSCQAALKLDPSNAKAMECLGVIAYKRGRLVEAEDCFRSSIRSDPQQGSYVDLAALCTQIGRYDDAESALNTALKLNRNDARALIELANLQLTKGELSKASASSRQAIFVDPRNDECYRALAIALVRVGQFTEAERVLRDAIARLDEVRRWRIHLLLSQVLIRFGDDNNKDRIRYEEAMQHVNAARRIKGAHDEVHFHAGIVHYRLEDFSAARKSFEDCVKANSERFDAERNATLMKQRIREIKKVNRINMWGGIGLAVFCLIGLLVLWVFFLTGWPGKVESSLITFMTPLLLGLIIVSLLLPNLNKLKLPGGFEAEISEPKPREISSGPKGEIGFGSSQEAISPGPR